MGYVIGFVVFVVGLLFSVAWHELGHFLPAKAFKVPVRQFFVGFGPTAWSTKRGETEYGLKWIPLGGYIRMVGMYRPDPIRPPKRDGWPQRLAAEAREASAEEMEPGEDSRAFYRLSVPKKLTVMLGGPLMNLILAVVLVAIVMCGIGQLTATTGIKDARAGGPAAAAGLHSGDKIVAWNGQQVATSDELIKAISATSGPAEATIERDGSTQTLTVTPERQDVKDSAGQVVGHKSVIGITMATERQRQPFTAVGSFLGQAIGQSVGVLVKLPVQVFTTARTVVEGQPRDPNGPLSIVGAGRLSAEIGAEASDPLSQVSGFLAILASMNLALCLFNLIPLLPLDGGHVAGALYEGLRRAWAKVRGRRDVGAVDTARAMPLAYGVFALLIVMSFVLILADIVAPVTIG